MKIKKLICILIILAIGSTVNSQTNVPIYMDKHTHVVTNTVIFNNPSNIIYGSGIGITNFTDYIFLNNTQNNEHATWKRISTNNKVFHMNRVVAPVSVSGGTKTTDGLYTIHTFTNSDNLVVEGSIIVEALVVAGGGGGGVTNISSYGGGGGGGGGLIHTSNYQLLANSYPVTVGRGGGVSGYGSNSILSTMTAIGGGPGGWYAAGNADLIGKDGGSGGGGSGVNDGQRGGYGISGQGHDGGTGAAVNASYIVGGGGGGAGTVGSNAVGSAAGSGGRGLEYSISGSAISYSGGGGGGSHPFSAAGVGYDGGGHGALAGGAASSGLANRGGGGGGGGTATLGGSGGSGVVIIRYLTSDLTNTVIYSDQEYLTAENPLLSSALVTVTLGNSNSDTRIMGNSINLSGAISITNGNLEIYSNLTVNGNISGCRELLSFGKTTGGTTNFYAGYAAITTSTNIAPAMIRNGSVVGSSTRINVSAQTTAGDLWCEVWINDVVAISNSIAINGTGLYSGWGTTNRNVFTFVPGDVLTVYHRYIGFAGNIANVYNTIEIVVDD